ncbi:MAG: hypothetical protein QOG67_1110 [Verrucomicrobiota bacterium]|jgi:hypothetical protein
MGGPGISLLIRLSNQGQLSQVLDVADRRIAKMAFVLAAEVRSVVVTDLKACLRRIDTFGEHEPPRLLKAEFLLKLQGADGCNGPTERTRVHREGGVRVAKNGRVGMLRPA